MRPKRDLLISKGWIQAVIIVGLFGFLIFGISRTVLTPMNHRFRPEYLDPADKLCLQDET